MTGEEAVRELRALSEQITINRDHLREGIATGTLTHPWFAEDVEKYSRQVEALSVVIALSHTVR